MQRIGFWLGVCLFVLLMALDPPDGLSLLGWRTAAVTVLMLCPNPADKFAVRAPSMFVAIPFGG